MTLGFLVGFCIVCLYLGLMCFKLLIVHVVDVNDAILVVTLLLI